MSDYAWIIDKDHVNDNADNGLIGPYDAYSERYALEQPDVGERFRMYNDDEVLCYEGRIIGNWRSGFEPLDDYGAANADCTRINYQRPVLCYEGRIIGNWRSGFEPLDDYGAANAGCTRISYQRPNGGWEMISSDAYEFCPHCEEWGTVTLTAAQRAWLDLMPEGFTGEREEPDTTNYQETAFREA
jgi:hypothetical protein